MKILIMMAHPDDPEVACGGTCAHWVRQGHQVVWVSTTNGDTGHHEVGGIELARRRYAEAQASADIGGISEYRILDNHCGELEASISNRREVIRMIRQIAPDLILTHRPYDYHPDHRATGQLVLDASYIVTVPNMVSLTDAPVFAPPIYYSYDKFTRPCAFAPAVVVSIDQVVEQKFQMLDCHVSQMYEWIPYNRGVLDQVPKDHSERLQWLKEQRLPASAQIADHYRPKLIELYGETTGQAVKYAEAFEECQYGGAADPAVTAGLFPMTATGSGR